MLKKIHKSALIFSMGYFISPFATANGLLLNDENLRQDLNWLNQQGVIQVSTSTWPLSEDEIKRVLSHAKVENSAQQLIVESVNQAISRQNQTIGVSFFAESDQKNIPQDFGDSQKSQLQASLNVNGGGENWAGRLQVNAEKKPQIENGDNFNVEGSYIAGKLWNQWLVAGQIPTYWGPGQDGSLIRGDASRPVMGVSMQRSEQIVFDNKWLSWIGPWQYQAFAGRLDDYKAVPDAKLLGLRLTAQPLPYLELGASRILQWGGEGRSQSFKSLWNAIKGNDNFDDSNLDNSNQIAGFDARLNLQPLLQLPIGLYGQYVGEDEAGLLPAKKLYLAGVDYSSNFKKMPYQVYAEWVDTRSNRDAKGISYNHHVYTDGYYQQGYPLGHSLGGDAEMISVGGNLRFDPMNRISTKLMYAKVNQSNRATNFAFPIEDNIKALDVTWTHYINPNVPLKLNGWIADSDQKGKDTGISLGVEFPLDTKILGIKK